MLKGSIVELGTNYLLNKWRVGNHGLEQVGVSGLNFVRGSKRGSDNVEKVDGVIHEELMEVMIVDLKYKNSLVPSKFAHATIQNLRDALMFQKLRKLMRDASGTLGTYAQGEGDLELSEYDLKVTNPKLNFYSSIEGVKVLDTFLKSKGLGANYFDHKTTNNGQLFTIEAEFEIELSLIRDELVAEFVGLIEMMSIEIEKGKVELVK